jgi:PAS domain-containing protein
MNTQPSLKEVHDRLGKKDEEIQRLARELDDVKNFMESIFQSIGSGIMVTGVNDMITYVNRAGERILGFSQNELIGKPLSSLSLRENKAWSNPFSTTPKTWTPGERDGCAKRTGRKSR